MTATERGTTMLKDDALTFLLRRNPCYSSEGDQAQLAEIIERYDALGADRGLQAMLWAIRGDDRWTDTNRILEKLLRMDPNHHDADTGEKILNNLHLIALAACHQAAIHGRYNKDHFDGAAE